MTRWTTTDLSDPPALSADTMRVVPLGGLGEVGRNMTVFEINGQLLVVDCGVLFPEETQPGVDLILPDINYIKDRLDDIVAAGLRIGKRGGGRGHLGRQCGLHLRQRGDRVGGRRGGAGGDRKRHQNQALAHGGPSGRKRDDALLAGHKGEASRA